MTRSSKIAVVGTATLPKQLGAQVIRDPALFSEDAMLVSRLADAGIAAQCVAWRDHAVNWNQFGTVLIRSTWDYIDDPRAFLDLLEQIERQQCHLVNPLETIRWNMDKRYLSELQYSGIPTLPTVIAEAPVSLDLESISSCEDGYVIKPALAVGAFGVRRLATKDAVVRELATCDEPHLVQPYIRSIPEEGEWSFVFAGGRFLYAVLKRPKAGDFRVQPIHGGTTMAVAPTSRDLDVAWAYFDGLPVTAHLARIDMVRTTSGDLALMEAELIEPQLFLSSVPSAADLLARAICRLVDAS